MKSSAGQLCDIIPHMNINTNIFHLYDIRGKYPEEFTEDDAHVIGHGFVHYLKSIGRKTSLTIAVGYDSRVSSPAVFAEFTKALKEEGCNVVDIGLITTPMLYFAVSHSRYDAGAMITASHNPNPYNGIKLTRERAIPLGGDEGIYQIRDYARNHDASHSKLPYPEGNLIEKNIEDDYVDFNLHLANVRANEFQDIKLAIDAGNGTGGPIAMRVLGVTGANVEPLYIEPDGRFPNHVPDPLIAENLKDIIALVQKEDFHFGVALDGDADRIIFIDEKGVPVSGDIMTALMVQILSDGKKGTKQFSVLYDVRSSRVVKETIESVHGIPVPYRIGHTLIKKKMREDNILFAGELSGHYYWGEDIFFEVPFVILLKLMERLQRTQKSFSELLRPLRKYYHSGEINFEIEDKEGKMRQLQEIYETQGEILLLDGLRVDFPDWWFLVRPSNTEPVLRLVIEADSPDTLQEKKEELTRLISEEL